MIKTFQNSSRSLRFFCLALLALVFILFNIVNQKFFHTLRFDFTNNHIYTLSNGSKQILENIKEPITLRYYYSKNEARNYPYLQSYAQRVEELLLQYAKASKGKLKLHRIYPEAFSLEEDEALHYGLKGVPVDSEGSEIFFGLVATDTINNKQKIDFFQPSREAYLEYDLSQILHKLTQPKSKVIGVIGSLPLSGEYSFSMRQPVAKPWMIWEQMQQLFELRKLAETKVTTIPEDIKLLLLANPTNLDEDTAKAIDSFVMRGGHILAFLDPFSEVSHMRANNIQDDTSYKYLHKLLSSWGINISKEIVANREYSKQVRYQQDGKEYSSHFALWMDIPKKHITEEVMTNNLEQITFATPGAITKRIDATTEMKPLITTGTDSMLVSSTDVNKYKQNPRELIQKFAPDGKDYCLAAKITGKIYSAFDVDKQEQKPYVNNSNIIIVADSDMLHDNFWVSVQDFYGKRIAIPTSGNGQLVLSSLEYLSGSSSLISIRNRGTFSRPFTKIEAIQLASEDKFKAKEQQLIAVMEEARDKLNKLEKSAKDSNNALTPEQIMEEESQFRKTLVATRKDLREVRHELNKDISNLQQLLKFIGTGLVPMLLTIFCIFMYSYSNQKKKKLPVQLNTLL